MTTPPEALEPTPSRPSRVVEGLGWVGVVVLVAVGAWLRLPLLELGYTSDEVGTVTDMGFRAIFASAETGVNPPLWQWMWNLPFGPWDAPWWGRRFSMACSLLAIVLAYGVARQGSGGRVAAGLAAAAVLAFHPSAIRYAAVFRIYAWWSALLLAHLLVLGRALDAEDPRLRRRWGALVVVTAMVLPWVHYFSVPVLAVLGVGIAALLPGRRAWILAYVPSALGVLPLVPAVLFEDGNRVAPSTQPLWMSLQQMIGLGLRPWETLAVPFRRTWASWFGVYPDAGAEAAALVLAVVLVGLVALRRLTRTTTVAGLSFVGVLVGVAILAQVQLVRPATLVMVVACAAPFLATAPFALPGRFTGHLVLAALVVVFGGGLPGVYAQEQEAWNCERSTPYVIEHYRDWDEVRAGRPLVIHPAHRLWTVWFHLAHDVPRKARRGPGCDGWRPCFEQDGVVWAGVDAVGDGALLDAIVVETSAWREPGFASTCEVLYDPGPFAIFDCRRGR